MTDANDDLDQYGTLDSEDVQEEQLETVEEVATTEDSESVDSSPQEEPKKLDDEAQAKVNSRFAKITAEKYQEKRRADELQRKIEELTGQKAAQPEAKEAPKLEDFDYDDDKYQEALIAYHVENRVSKALSQVQQTEEQKRAEQTKMEVASSFDKKELEYVQANPSYVDEVANLPTFGEETLYTIYSLDNAPEVAHYLSKNLEVAHSIASANPINAALQLGQIASKLTAKAAKEVDVSKAPDPVSTLTGAGSAITEKPDPLLAGAKFE